MNCLFWIKYFIQNLDYIKNPEFHKIIGWIRMRIFLLFLDYSKNPDFEKNTLCKTIHFSRFVYMMTQITPMDAELTEGGQVLDIKIHGCGYRQLIPKFWPTNVDEVGELKLGRKKMKLRLDVMIFRTSNLNINSVLLSSLSSRAF